MALVKLRPDKDYRELRQRIREVRQGPDGALYIIAGDALLRVTPR